MESKVLLGSIGFDFVFRTRTQLRQNVIAVILVKAGLTTDMVVLETLPNVWVPLACRACGKIHRWTPNDAWAGDIPKLVHSA